MDFHSLARKELQALCKKNKIPANLTNVAMADALKALQKVEGLDELGNAQQTPEKITKAEPRTALRTSTRKKLVNVEPESSQILTRTRRTARKTVAEEGDNENKFNLPETPVPTNRRRGPAASTRRNIDTRCGEDEKREVQEKIDVPKTPSIRSSRSEAPAVSSRRKVEAQKDEISVQKVYGTRHSVRLLEKTMADLSLKEEKKIEAVKFDGLCEETEQVEQQKDLPDELLENDCEKYEALEDNKPNDHEVNQLPENECEMKHKVNDNKSDECEVDSDENQNIDQFLGSERKRNVELLEDNNKSETTDCGIKLAAETCANSKILSGLDAEEDGDSSDTFIQAIDMIHESIDEKGSDAQITENPEKTMNSVLETEMKKELQGNQYESDDCTAFLMETEHKSIANVPDEISNVVNSLTDEELTEDVSKSSKVNKQHMVMVDDLVEDDWHKLDSDSDETPREARESSEISKEHMEKAECNNADDFNTSEITAIDAQTSDLVKDDCHDFDSYFDETPSSVPQKSPSLVSDMTSDDGHVVPAEEFGSIQAFDKKTPTSKVSLPFAGNTIQGQFPRPTEGKSSPKKQTTIEKMILGDEFINKENINCGGEVDDKVLLNEMSLRQLTKALKEKLQIKNNLVSKVETRLALQKLPENAAKQVNNKIEKAFEEERN